MVFMMNISAFVLLCLSKLLYDLLYLALTSSIQTIDSVNYTLSCAIHEFHAISSSDCSTVLDLLHNLCFCMPECIR